MTKSLPLVAYQHSQEQIEAVERDGFVYLPNVLNDEEIETLKQLMSDLDAIPQNLDTHTCPEKGDKFLNKIINNSFNRHEHFLQFLDKTPVIDIAEGLHGEDCHCIGMQSWITGPGRPDQALHTDWLPLSLPSDILEDPRVKVPVFITTAHYYLNDMYEELGPTKFVPGSHFSGRSPEGDTYWKERGEESILCRAGDVVIFRSEVWHRGSANKSDESRYLLQVHYSKRMITQKYPPYFGQFRFDTSIVRECNPRQRRLLGDHKPSNYD